MPCDSRKIKLQWNKLAKKDKGIGSHVTIKLALSKFCSCIAFCTLPQPWIRLETDVSQLALLPLLLVPSSLALLPYYFLHSGHILEALTRGRKIFERVSPPPPLSSSIG